MKKSMKKFFALTVAVAFLLPVFTGCGDTAGNGGSPQIEAPADGRYDFSTAYITDRDNFELDESWRAGALGSGPLKVTSGNEYTAWNKSELPAAWVMGLTIGLPGGSEDVIASVRFNADKNAEEFSFEITRKDGQITASWLYDGKTVNSSGAVTASDVSFECILDKSGDIFKLYVTGNVNFKHYSEVSKSDTSAISGVKHFGFYANKPGVAFEKIGLNILVYKAGEIMNSAKRGIDDIIKNFWDGDQSAGNFTNCSQTMVWEYGMAVLALETMYDATGDRKYKDYIAAQWAYMKKRFGLPESENDMADYADQIGLYKYGKPPNTACDDAAWTAMTLMSAYRMTGDKKALIAAAQVVRQSYEYWKDGSVDKGIWYRLAGETGDTGSPHKSVYNAGLILTALEYDEATRGTPLNDPKLLNDTMTLYNWNETYLRRDKEKTYGTRVISAADHLYFCSFSEGDGDSPLGPVGDVNGGGIGEAGSCSSLFGNTAMAAINAILYKRTGQQEYLDKALATANSIPKSVYNRGGILLNDRDAWTNAAFMRYWVNEVLTLEGTDKENIELVINTGLSVASKCRTDSGHYRAEWGGGNKWSTGQTKPEQLTTTSTSVHMIAAGALAEKLGLANK